MVLTWVVVGNRLRLGFGNSVDVGALVHGIGGGVR
jgi:hypothetical protein